MPYGCGNVYGNIYGKGSGAKKVMDNTVLKNALIQYFEKGQKKERHRNIGVEIEHFILRSDTLEAVSYEGVLGVKGVLARLMKLYPEAKILPGEDLLGFETPEFLITLEPAAQLEISLAPCEDAVEIDKRYGAFLANLESVLQPMGYCAMTVGCQPVSVVRSLSLIPKERYRLMDRHFAKTGTGGVEMMRGTASAQVSADYFSEEDFSRKIQAMYFLSPTLKLLTDSANRFEGKKLERRLKRTDIWNRTDPSRCGVLPGIFSPDYGYADYADFLCAMPPIFLTEKGECRPTGFRTAGELFAEKNPTEEDVVHILSMAFPDIRLKRYLEIRIADAADKARMTAYFALVKGLVYSEEALDFCQEKIRAFNLTEKDIRQTEDNLSRRGWDGSMYGRLSVRNFAREIVGLAARNLPEQEAQMLPVLLEPIERKT